MFSFGLWCKIAACKPEMLFVDGSIGKLMAVRQSSPVVKVYRHGYHRHIKHDHVYALRLTSSSEWVSLPWYSLVQTRELPPQTYYIPERLPQESPLPEVRHVDDPDVLRGLFQLPDGRRSEIPA
jgi:hypothetical protein